VDLSLLSLSSFWKDASAQAADLPAQEQVVPASAGLAESPNATETPVIQLTN